MVLVRFQRALKLSTDTHTLVDGKQCLTVACFLVQPRIHNPQFLWFGGLVSDRIAMTELFYCGFMTHLKFRELGDTGERFVFRLNNLEFEEKYGTSVKKAFIGWCTLFVVPDSGHLLHISTKGSSRSSIEECCVANCWDLKLLECGTKDIYLVLSDRLPRRWKNDDFKVEPQLVNTLAQKRIKVREISVGSSFVCALLEDGSVEGMDEQESLVSFEPLNGDKFVSVTCGHEHILLLTESGKVYSYGRGSKGQLGLESLDDSFEQQKEIEALSGIKIMQISAGGWHSLVLSEFGDIYAFGWNESGQLGIGSEDAIKALPTLIELNDVNFISISCGSRHSMSVSERGDLYSWGWNKYGQLGLDPKKINNQKSPIKVEFSRKAVSVTCKYWSSLIETT